MEFSRQEYWSGSPFPSPGDLPRLGIESRSPAWQADSLQSEPPGKSIFESGFAQIKVFLCLITHLFLTFSSAVTFGFSGPGWGELSGVDSLLSHHL